MQIQQERPSVEQRTLMGQAAGWCRHAKDRGLERKPPLLSEYRRRRSLIQVGQRGAREELDSSKTMSGEQRRGVANSRGVENNVALKAASRTLSILTIERAAVIATSSSARNEAHVLSGAGVATVCV
eukprot:6189782-Pleurochrysis_carterae.AAC.3